MKQLGVSTYQLFLFVFVATIFTMLLTAFPVKASALEATTQTTQMLPVGGNSCTPIFATNFTPYVYNGALHSFEFTLPDASYVALLGSIGNTPLSFQLMTRRVDSSGMLRVHVDVATTPILGPLPLKVSLLSARAGSPVCLTVVSMGVGPDRVSIQSNPVMSTAPASSAVSVVPVTAPTVVTLASKANSVPPISTTKKTLTASSAGGSVVNTMQNSLRNVCASDTSAYRLWLILLVLYTLIVGAALWAEFPMSMAWTRTPERIATIILVFLLLLLAFWYFSISCRAALWMPLVAFLVAVLGLLAAFWNHPRVTQMLLTQETKPTSIPIVTPPPKK